MKEHSAHLPGWGSNQVQSKSSGEKLLDGASDDHCDDHCEGFSFVVTGNNQLMFVILELNRQGIGIMWEKSFRMLE